jgi:RimJ/RimL family protein N-acetyltransferase
MRVLVTSSSNERVTFHANRPSMHDQIQTLRLRIEPFSSDDLAAAFAWFSDPEVMRFIPTGPDRSMEETKKRLTRYIEHQTLHGFSKWIIRERASGQAIGDAGLLVLEDLGKIDLGFRFARSYWGRGLATEAAAAWVRAAFVDFEQEHLTAFAHPENLASLRVLQKLHFRSMGRDRVMGMDSLVFSLSAAEFQLLAGKSTG